MSNGVQSNYVSDASILAWVENQQQMQYGQLKGAMDFETTRGEMLQDLAKIKSELRDAAKNTDNIGQLNEDVQAFLAKYGEVFEFADIAGVVSSVADAVGAKAEENATLQDRIDEHNRTPPEINPETGEPVETDPPKAAEPFSKEEVEGWNKSLDEMGDTANHNEQLGMIRINEIKSNIDHSAEVASQLIKSSNDTTAFAINNIV